jgi:hypothetical protein
MPGVKLRMKVKPMQATLTDDARACQLRPGVQRAIASSANDDVLAVELELVSILDGPAFQGSARSRAFLSFVVEETLAGRQDLLKERTIGIAVMGKKSDYDTGADSTVRVRANEVRKRLAAHYEAVATKAAIRIELPPGSYAPKFTVVALPAAVEQRPRPPAMLLWQLAAPTLVAVFLSLVAIRGGVESGDVFSRFWDRAMIGRSGITVVLDSEIGGSVSPAMADAALPIERLSEELQVPVHVRSADTSVGSDSFVIRLSLKEKPGGGRWLHVGSATAALIGRGDRAMWLWAETPEALRAAARALTTRSGFPGFLYPNADPLVGLESPPPRP